MTEEQNGQTTGPGRPADAEASARLKAAALRLTRQKGYSGVSIAAIIAEAGVARQTLYNRWKTKADLVLEALFEQAGLQVARPDATAAGGYGPALAAFLAEVFGHLEQDGDLLRNLIAAAQEDPQFRESFRHRFVDPREAIVLDFLAEAQAAGALPRGSDPEMLSAFIHGAFWYRLLNARPLGPDLAARIAAQIFAR